jgi:dGTPase
MIPEFGEQEMVKDYIAGMTDRFAMNQYTEIFMPRGL